MSADFRPKRGSRVSARDGARTHAIVPRHRRSRRFTGAAVPDYAGNASAKQPQNLRSPEEAQKAALAKLEEVSAVLARKSTPEEATEFKQWLLGIGQRVAEASNEGGFLGFGGVPVSDAEKATLADIARALKLPA